MHSQCLDKLDGHTDGWTYGQTLIAEKNVFNSQDARFFLVLFW